METAEEEEEKSQTPECRVMMCKHTYDSGTCQKLHKKALPPKPPIKLTLKRKFELDSKTNYDSSTEDEGSDTEEETQDVEMKEEKEVEKQEVKEEQEVTVQPMVPQPIVIEDSNSAGLPPVMPGAPMEVQVNENNAGTNVNIFPQEKVHGILQNSGKRKRPPKTSSGNTARQKLVKVWLYFINKYSFGLKDLL